MDGNNNVQLDMIAVVFPECRAWQRGMASDGCGSYYGRAWLLNEISKRQQRGAWAKAVLQALVEAAAVLGLRKKAAQQPTWFLYGGVDVGSTQS
jgi:hypothetical protein